MERTVHRVTNTIACHFGGKAILLTVADFRQLARKLMHDLGDEVVDFEMAVVGNMHSGAAKEKHKEWEQLFCQRLTQEVKSGEFLPAYDFQDEEAREYVEDFLEAYRSSYRFINIAFGDLHDGTDYLINISLRRKQTLINRVFRKYGEAYDELNFMKSKIRRVSGTSLDFTIEITTCVYRFGPKGVRQVR